MRWINWALDHVFILIVIATVIAGWVNKFRTVMRERPRGDFRGERAEDDRARDIQDEIRRKIAERTARQPSPPLLPPVEPPASAQPTADRPDSALRQRLERKLTEAREREEAALGASKRRRLEAEARALEAERQEEERARVVVKRVELPAFPVHVQGAVHPLVAALREPASVRRAIVLREILGPPLALR